MESDFTRFQKLTVKTLFSGRASSSLEALRFPSLAAPPVSKRDGMVKVGPTAVTVRSGQARERVAGADRKLGTAWML
jgi:hypothetical protein